MAISTNIDEYNYNSSMGMNDDQHGRERQPYGLSSIQNEVYRDAQLKQAEYYRKEIEKSCPVTDPTLASKVPNLLLLCEDV